MQSNAGVYANSDKVTVCGGPYVCAAESVYNIEHLHDIFIDKNLKADVEYSQYISKSVSQNNRSPILKPRRSILNFQIFCSMTESAP